VVPGRDTRALADRLVMLLTDTETARAMGDKGRAWVERDWSWDQAAARLRAMIDALSSSSPSA
jgi:phosphatidylinositol alpha-1,6-mannosyltransferase